MSRPIRLLILEDQPEDAELMVLQLRRSGFAPDWRRVDTAAAFLASLEDGLDLILSDYEMPQFNGLQALKILQQSGLDIPFILISGTIGEETAVTAMKEGATDYLLKDRLGRLESAVRHALEEHRLRRERRRMETHLAAMSEMGARLSAARTAREAAQVILEVADQLFGWDACTLDLYSREKDELIHVLNQDLLGGQKVEMPLTAGMPKLSAFAREVIEQGGRLILKDPRVNLPGAVPFGDVSRPSASILYVPIRCGQAVTGLLAIHSYTADAYGPDDLQALQALADHCGGALERIRAGEALGQSEVRYRSLVETTFDWIWEVDANARYTYVSPKVRELLGREPEDVLGRTPFDLMPEAEARRVAAAFGEIAAQRRPFAALENTNLHKSGRLVVLETSGAPIFGPDGEFRGYRGMDRDITERKRAEEALALRAKMASLAAEIGIVLTREHDLRPMLGQCAEVILRHLEVAFVRIWILNPQDKVLELRASAGLYTHLNGPHSRMPVGRLKIGAIAAERRPYQTNQVVGDPLVNDQEWARREGMVAFAGYPLVVEDQLVGVIALFARQPLSETAFKELASIADGIALGIQRVQAEAALRESEERHRILFGGSHDAILVLAPPEFRFVSANPAALTVFGAASESELCALGPGDASPACQPDGRPSSKAAREMIEAALRNGSHFFEWTYRRLSGEEFHAVVSLTRREFSGQVLLKAVIRDITERKRVEQELRQRLDLQNQLGQVAATVPGMVYSFRQRPDGSFCLPYASAALERMFGLKPEQVREDAAPALAMIHPDDLGALKEAIATSARTLGIWRREFRVRGPRSDAIWVEAHAVPQLESDGGLLWHGFLHDITERKRLEEQFRHAQKLEAVGQLAGGVAHDFNNIISATMLHLGVLEDHPYLDERVKESLREIEAGVNRAAALTRQLLLFSRQSVMKLRALDVNEVVENLLKMLRRLIGEHIQVHWQGRSGLPSVMADAGMLEQVILNLVVNARDAVAQGGDIILATDTVAVDAAQVPSESKEKAGRYVRLSVSDTGCGIPEDIQARIFEPFFTTKEVGKGTGLGLATAFSIVQQHRGWIKVESQVGRGSTFHVFLPACEEPAARAGSTPETQPVPRGHETILLVEDDDALRHTVCTYLRRQGYRLLPASNAVVALAVWERHQAEVDLLFTDVVMPGDVSGLELAERLLRERPSLKVMISSGYSEELVKLGDVLDPRIIRLAKPYDPPQLAETIRRCLDRAAG